MVICGLLGCMSSVYESVVCVRILCFVLVMKKKRESIHRSKGRLDIPIGHQIEHILQSSPISRLSHDMLQIESGRDFQNMPWWGRTVSPASPRVAAEAIRSSVKHSEAPVSNRKQLEASSTHAPPTPRNHHNAPASPRSLTTYISTMSNVSAALSYST